MSHQASAASESIETRVGRIADEFTQRLNDGEQPDIEEYTARFPDLADVLREVLPALNLMRLAGGENGLPSDWPLGQDQRGNALGDFRILREVARGGMGIVYEAEQISLSRRVALKVLPFAATLDPRQMQRFKNEAQAAACLHHSNIVPVYAVGCERGVPYYAMQFIEGQSLAEALAGLIHPAGRLDPEAPLPAPNSPTRPVASLTTERPVTSPAYVRAIAQLGVQAAQALDYAHQVGIVHRDIKPANLLLEPSGRLWITDFGLAHWQAGPRLTQTGDLLGTLRYLSPEQARGKGTTSDPRSDLYSLGATFYEALTLKPAIPGETREEVLRQITLEEPVSPRKLNPAIPAALETILEKSMRKEPEGRYSTAQELADDLQRFLDHRPILARKPTWGERLGKAVIRHRKAAAAAVAVALVCLAGLVTATVVIYQEKEAARKAYDLARDESRRAQENLAEAKAQERRAAEIFEKALDGATSLLLRLEDPRWMNIPGIEDIRRDLVEHGLTFFRGFLHEDSPDPVIRYQTARTYGLMASVYMANQQVEPAFQMMARALHLYEELADKDPKNLQYRLGAARVNYSKGLLHISLKETEKAREEFIHVARHYQMALAYDTTGAIYNRFGWHLVDCPITDLRDPAKAVSLAQHAVEVSPGEWRYWNTLGVAQYRSGTYAAAIDSLNRSKDLHQGGDAFDWFYLAMAHAQVGHSQQARQWFDKAVKWSHGHQPQDESLVRVEKEAEKLLNRGD